MNRPVVLLTDYDLGTPDRERAILEAAGFELRLARDGLALAGSEEALIAEARAADAVALLVQYAAIGARVFEALPDLRAVARYGVGLDPIDLDAARQHGVAVVHVPEYCLDEVADHAFGLLLTLTRGIARAAAQTGAGRWPLAGDLEPLTALRGRSLGLVGLGRIGHAVAERARPFGLRLRTHDPFVDADALGSAGIEAVSLEDVFTSDIVSLHLPLTPTTRGLIGATLLERMPEGSILVNVARGGVIDEAALLEALDRGRPALAGLDVLATEQPTPDHPLLRHPRVVVTPHVAYYSAAALDRLCRQTAEVLVAALREAGVVGIKRSDA